MDEARVEQPAAVHNVDIVEPEKFEALRQFVTGGSFTIRSVEAQLGRMVNVGVLCAKGTWQHKDPWSTAKRAHAKLQDPALLAAFWRGIAFQRGRMLGNVRIEAQMAASYAILDVIGEMFGEG